MGAEAHRPLNVEACEVLAPVPDVEAFQRGQFPVEALVRQPPGIFSILQKATLDALVLFVRSFCHHALLWGVIKG
jgi:hypothetical protein